MTPYACTYIQSYTVHIHTKYVYTPTQNIIAGAVFGGWFGVPLVCMLAATGASMCFLLSKGFGHDIIYYYLKDRLLPIKNLVSPLKKFQKI